MRKRDQPAAGAGMLARGFWDATEEPRPQRSAPTCRGPGTAAIHAEAIVGVPDGEPGVLQRVADLHPEILSGVPRAMSMRRCRADIWPLRPSGCGRSNRGFEPGVRRSGPNRFRVNDREHGAA
jgi:hypothetical protein